MNKKEISQYIIDKKIPLRFIWENDIEYFFFIWYERYYTHSIRENFTFPNWCRNIMFYNAVIMFGFYDNKIKNSSKFIHIEKETIEQCLGEFLIWWEINKGRCKSIEYYKEI